MKKWTHIYTTNPMPGEGYGSGGPALFNFDGDMDIVSKIWNKDSPAYTPNYWRNDND